MTAIAAGIVAWIGANKASALSCATLLLFVAALPAMYGLLGFLYVPGVLLLLVAIATI